MRKILFVIADMGIGGVQRSILPILSATPKQWDVTLRLFSDAGELMDQIPEHIHIEIVSTMRHREGLRRVVSSSLQKIGIGKLFSAVKKIYHCAGGVLISSSAQDTVKFDVAVAYQDGLVTWYVAQCINADKKIAFVHTDFLVSGYNPVRENAVYPCFSRVYFSSALAREHFCSIVHIPLERTAILHNCIDKARIQANAQEAGFTDYFSGLRILTIGRLSHEKGLDKVAKLLRWLCDDGFNVRWYLIGDGPERGLLLRQAQEYHVADFLFLLGKKRNPYPFLAQCDIYVQPSNYESYCIALAEARFFRRPILACDFAGAREQLEDGKDGYITPFEAEEMYPKLMELVQNGVHRKAFQRALEEKADMQHGDVPIEILFSELGSM